MKQRRWVWLAVLWVLAISLLAWVVQAISWSEFREVAGRLGVGPLAALLVINVGILFLFGLRWWLILRAEGVEVSVISVFRYRLAAFGVSYFTPGPHFGGEPLQVYFIHRRHGAPMATALATVTLDKLIELLINFAFLMAGLITVAASGLLGGELRWEAALAAGGALSLPALYLLGLWRGQRPITGLTRGLAARFPAAEWWERISSVVEPAENQMGEFGRNHPVTVLVALGVSLLAWCTMILEFGLLLHFLGIRPGLSGLIAIMTAARLALLTPLPGALGALEGGQVLAFEALGYGPEVGLAVSLLIRGRDVCFGLVGLLWGGVFNRRI